MYIFLKSYIDSHSSTVPSRIQPKSAEIMTPYSQNMAPLILLFKIHVHIGVDNIEREKSEILQKQILHELCVKLQSTNTICRDVLEGTLGLNTEFPRHISTVLKGNIFSFFVTAL